MFLVFLSFSDAVWLHFYTSCLPWTLVHCLLLLGLVNIFFLLAYEKLFQHALMCFLKWHQTLTLAALYFVLLPLKIEASKLVAWLQYKGFDQLIYSKRTIIFILFFFNFFYFYFYFFVFVFIFIFIFMGWGKRGRLFLGQS